MNAKQTLSVASLILSLGLTYCDQASAQCILANPSFEIAGSGGETIGGWNQFGNVGLVDVAVHGAKAARLTSLNAGSWQLSAYWQRQDTVPGERWEITGHVQHPSAKQLVGANVALVNVEWRNAAGDLIDYDSYTVADADSPTDQYLDFSVISSPAPASAVATHVLFGVLQSPSDPSSDVYFDQVTVANTSPPLLDDVQWNNFPGERELLFGGQTWRVKGPGVYGPGNNYFCDANDCVWVDDQNRLHLTMKNRGLWISTEVTTTEALGYGDYILTTVGRVDLIDPEVVLGIFLWQYGPCWDYSYTWWGAYNEIDIEYSRWGNPAAGIGQFVAQPFDWPGNIDRFDATFGAEEVTSHAMRWLPDHVEYRVWRGGPHDESAQSLIHAWTYTGPHIPRPEQPRMHLNLWKHGDPPASDQEIIFQDFNFIPVDGVSHAAEPTDRVIPGAPAGRLNPAAPNPFNPRTSVSFVLVKDEFIELGVYDMSGRLVRTIATGLHTAGLHEVVWNGQDDGGQRVASGVYLVRLSGDGFVETRSVSLIK